MEYGKYSANSHEELVSIIADLEAALARRQAECTHLREDN